MEQNFMLRAEVKIVFRRYKKHTNSSPILFQMNPHAISNRYTNK